MFIAPASIVNTVLTTKARSSLDRVKKRGVAQPSIYIESIDRFRVAGNLGVT